MSVSPATRIGMVRKTMLWAAVTAVTGLTPIGSWGATVWTAASAGYWTNAANWTPSTVPGTADDVVFDASSVQNCTIDGDVNIQSLTIADLYTGSIVFTQGVPASLSITNDFSLGAGATVVADYVTTNALGTGRTITVGGNATINGILDANNRGFPLNTAPGGYRGPGGTPGQWPSGHGGLCGDGSGIIYGSLTGPAELGSGSYGNNGGGAIALVVAGTATINGTVRADSVSAAPHGASGGSVWLTCNTFAGSGTVSAKGGNVSGFGVNGGGGRVSISYGTKSFTGTVSVAGGKLTGYAEGQPGSLWEPGRFTNPVASVVLDGENYQYFFPGTASNYTWGLTVTNSAAIYLHNFTNGTLVLTNTVVAKASSLRFDVDAAGKERKKGRNSLIFSNAIQVLDRSVLGLSEGLVGPSPVTFSILSTSTVCLGAQTYTLDAFDISTGSVAHVGQCDTNAVNADSGGTAGNPHGSGLVIHCASANILGTMNASSNGFQATTGPGTAANMWDGGSHGGSGGGQGGPPSGPCYGLLTRPSALGSGAKYGGGHFAGGAIKLVVANSLVINGAIRADGGTHGSYGGDSGGSIWLVSQSLSGTGVVSASGGYGNLSGGHGGGGGGRIALEYVSSTFGGAIASSNGFALSSAYPARTGTVFLCQSPVVGAVSEGTQGRYLLTQYSVNNHTGGVKITRSVAQWRPKWFEWTDQSTDWATGAQLNNIATYTVTGVTANVKFDVSDNGLFLFQTNSGAGGFFSFNITLDAPHTVSVKAAVLGTIFVIH